jgi:hypothetical protein
MLLDGFSYLAPSEVASLPGTLRSQGMAFDGSTPVFSWRYGLQRTDPVSYKPTLAYPMDFPADIRAIFATFGNKPDYGHIGDIDRKRKTLRGDRRRRQHSVAGLHRGIRREDAARSRLTTPQAINPIPCEGASHVAAGCCPAAMRACS